MLEHEGFGSEGYVDIFDGGPTMSVRTDEIRTIREARDLVLDRDRRRSRRQEDDARRRANCANSPAATARSRSVTLGMPRWTRRRREPLGIGTDDRFLAVGR